MLLVGCFTILLTVGFYQVWHNDVGAAIVNSQAWSSVYAGTAFPGSYTYAITTAAGNDRLLVVAVQSTVTAAATQTCSVIWGGKTLTQATGNGTTSGQAHTYLFYLKEADIATATGTSLAVSVAGGTTSYNMVRAAVYTGVEQSVPVSTIATYNSAATAVTTVGPLNPTLTIPTGSQAIEIINLSRTGSTTSRTITVATPWATLLTSATGSGTGTIGVRNYMFGDTTAASGITGQWTASGTTLAAMSAMVITAKLPTSLTVTNNAIEPTGHRIDTDAGVVMQRLTVTGSGPIELNSVTLDDLGTTSVLASAEIYISPTLNPSLPADAVLLASATNWGGTSAPFSLTNGTQANRTLGGTEPLTKYIYVVYDFSAGTAGKTAQSTVTAVGVVSPNTGASGLNLKSNIVTLDYSGNQLQVQASTTTGASAAKDSDVAVVMQHFQVDCDSAFDNALQINSVTVQDLGTNADPTTGVGVAAVKIYVSPTEGATPDALPSSAVLVGQLNSWNKSLQTILLNDDLDTNANQGAARTVFAGTPKYIYVVYSMYYRDNPDYFATPDVTVQSKVTAVGVTPTDIGKTGINYLSNTIHLTRGTWSKITNCGSCHETTDIYDNPQRELITNVNGTFGRYPGSHRVHTVTNGYDCNQCHLKPKVFNHANGFINFSGQLWGNKYTRSDGNNRAPVVNGIYAFGTCNSTNCHGQVSAAWATDMSVYNQCDKCHAGPTYSGDFYSTAGTTATSTTDAHTGVHTSHLKATHGIVGSGIACNTCHSAVATVKASGHMNGVTDVLSGVAYSIGNCTNSCHKMKAAKWNSPSLTGVKTSDCTLCHDLPPLVTPAQISAHTSAKSSFDAATSNKFAVCAACHSHVNSDGTFNNISLHMNGTVDTSPSSGNVDCSICHGTLAAMTSQTTSYHHVLASTSVDYAGNTCLKCHADHNIFQAAQNAANNVGVSANLRVSNAVTPVAGAPGTTYTNTDYIAGSEGICVSCHKNAITKNTTAQKTDASINTTTMVVTDAQYSPSAHNYKAPSTFTKDSSAFQGNCSKCHNDTLAETKQVLPNTFGLHLSATRELFSPLGSASGQDAREGLLCFGCHSVQGQQIDAQTKKPTALKDWYGVQTMRASAEDTFSSFSTATRVFRHNTGKYSAKHQVGESETYIAANKHVECADCHNSHGASYGNHTQGSATLANVLVGATGLVPVYGSGSGPGLPGVTGTTLYFKNTSPGTPTAKQTTSTPINVTAFTSRDMSTGTGATASTQAISIPTATVASTYFMGTAFVSPAMTAGTIPAQTYTVNVAVNASSSTSPNRARLVAYAYVWNGTTKTLIAGPTTNTGAYLPTTKATQIISLSSATATTVAAGDRLVIEVYVVTGTSATTAAMTATLYYGSATDTSNVAMTTGGVWNTASSYTPGTATQEYQICFKCHTPANTSYASWGGTAAASWTDLAMEFNPNNASRHPIGTPLAVGSQLTAAKLAGGWTPGQVMNCTDCHATDSTASKGPHGSSVKWMLAGTNKAWPYTAASANGTSTGTLVRINTYSAGVGTANGLFCLNCHTVTASNNFHSVSGIASGQHAASATVAACVSCHIRVPHGGKITRLRLTTNAPTRYRADGNATTPAFTSWPAPGAAASGNWTGSCGTHSGGTEAW